MRWIIWGVIIGMILTIWSIDSKINKLQSSIDDLQSEVTYTKNLIFNGSYAYDNVYSKLDNIQSSLDDLKKKVQ